MAETTYQDIIDAYGKSIGAGQGPSTNVFLQRLRDARKRAKEEDKQTAKSIKSVGKLGLLGRKHLRDFQLAQRGKPDLTLAQFFRDPATSAKYVNEGARAIKSGTKAPIGFLEAFNPLSKRHLENPVETTIADTYSLPEPTPSKPNLPPLNPMSFPGEILKSEAMAKLEGRASMDDDELMPLGKGWKSYPSEGGKPYYSVYDKGQYIPGQPTSATWRRQGLPAADWIKAQQEQELAEHTGQSLIPPDMIKNLGGWLSSKFGYSEGGRVMGNVVPGSGSGDIVNTRVNPGDFVLNRRATDAVRGGVRGYKEGGKIPIRVEPGEAIIPRENVTPEIVALNDIIGRYQYGGRVRGYQGGGYPLPTTSVYDQLLEPVTEGAVQQVAGDVGKQAIGKAVGSGANLAGNVVELSGDRLTDKNLMKTAGSLASTGASAAAAGVGGPLLATAAPVLGPLGVALGIGSMFLQKRDRGGRLA